MNNLATSLIISTRLQLLTSFSILVDNLRQTVRTQLVEFLRVWLNHANKFAYTVCKSLALRIVEH
jgi:hypothetical protein